MLCCERRRLYVIHCKCRSAAYCTRLRRRCRFIGARRRMSLTFRQQNSAAGAAPSKCLQQLWLLEGRAPARPLLVRTGDVGASKARHTCPGVVAMSASITTTSRPSHRKPPIKLRSASIAGRTRPREARIVRFPWPFRPGLQPFLSRDSSDRRNKDCAGISHGASIAAAHRHRSPKLPRRVVRKF